MRGLRLFVACGVLLSASVAFAQGPSAVARVAHAFPTRVDSAGAFTQTVRQRLADRGFVDGRNLELRFFSQRASEAAADPLRAQQQSVAEVIAWRPDVILVGNPASTRLFQKATTSIPIVFANITDPQTQGFVASLSRPGANVTGSGIHYDGLSVKRLELVRTLLPSARRVLVISDARNGGIPAASRSALQAAAVGLGMEIIELDVATVDGGLCAVSRRAIESRAAAILPWGSIDAPSGYRAPKPWGAQMYGECLAIAQRESGVPVLDDSLDTVRQGTALALGEDQNDTYRRSADLVAQILAGAKPATLPVDMQMSIRLHVNARSLRELGIAATESLLLRADNVID
jgi:putative ABC transport system substrate-binding protein